MRNYHVLLNGNLLVEKHGGVHYVRGNRIRRSERGPYMDRLVAAAKIKRQERLQLRKDYPGCRFG